jgi:hypothetical protein
MTPDEAAKATHQAVVEVPAQFMLDPATYTHGGDLGFEGMNYYVAGRGGVLGPCDADVVSAAFVFFNPDSIRTAWEASAEVMPAASAAAEWAGSCHQWAEDHVADGVDCARFAELAGRIVAGASPAGAPVFAGWRRLDVPESPKAAALHQLNALRELRCGLHGGAILSSGLRPEQAVAVNSPHMAPLFGWADLPDVDGLRDTWQHSDDATDTALGDAYDALSSDELAEIVLLAQAFASAAAGQPG